MGLIDFFFPKNCLECGTLGKYICEDCLKKVVKSGWWGRNYSIFKYEGVIRKAVIALKYKYSYQIARELSDVCVQSLKHLNLINNKYLLVPIPLHYLRKNFRGFNQSEEVGRLIAKSMYWQFEPNLLIKNKSTLHQVGLKGEARRKNLQNVFCVNPSHILNTAYNILIFDDVMTTGSTLLEARKALEKVGFKNVWGLTICR